MTKFIAGQKIRRTHEGISLTKDKIYTVYRDNWADPSEVLIVNDEGRTDSYLSKFFELVEEEFNVGFNVPDLTDKQREKMRDEVALSILTKTAYGVGCSDEMLRQAAANSYKLADYFLEARKVNYLVASNTDDLEI